MPSPCPNKDRCGSCSWSHIPYETQLQQKLSDINGSFKLKELDVRVQEIAPSPITEHYRNRMDFVIDFEGRVGMREKGKWWRVIDGHHCFLADKQIEDLFNVVRDWARSSSLSYFDRKAHTGLLRYAVIRATTTGDVMITIVTSAPEPAEAQRLEETLQELSSQATPRDLCKDSSASVGMTSVIHSINHTVSDVSFGTELHTISGPGYIEEVINTCRYRITPNAFFQTNPHGAAILLDTVAEFAGDLSEKTLLDLYCGSGFFGIGLAIASSPNLGEVPQRGGGVFSKKYLPFYSPPRLGEAKETSRSRAHRIIGVELVPDAIRDAQVNAEINNVDIEFHEAATEDFDWGQYGADTVILDPPRSGMHDQALADVLRIKPETIIYVSCNYKNFARELVQLQQIYDVKAMRAIDMFPHTPHVELVTKLVRR